MNPATIALIIQLVEQIIAEYPQISSDLREHFANKNPSPGDWAILRERVLSKSYRDYVPKTKLPQP